MINLKSDRYVFVLRLLGSLTSFVAISYYSKQISSTALGIYFLYELGIQVLSIPADFGIKGAITKRVSESDNTSGIFLTSLAIKLTLVILIAIMLFLFRSSVNSYVGSDIYIELIIGLIFREVMYVFIQHLHGEGRVFDATLLLLIRSVIAASISVILLYYEYSVAAIIYGNIVSYILVGVTAFLTSSPEFGRPSTAAMKSIAQYSKYNFLEESGGVVYNWMDTAMIALFLTASDVSSYEIAWRFSVFILLPAQVIRSVNFPRISLLSSNDSIQQVSDQLSHSLNLVLIVVLPAVVGASLLSDQILVLVFSPEYRNAQIVLLILLFDVLIQSFQNIYGSALSAIDKPNHSVKGTILSITTNLIANLSLIPIIGINGAAIATVASSSIDLIVNIYYLNKFVNLDFQLKPILSVILSTVVMGVGVLWLKDVVMITNVVELFCVVAFGVLSYAIPLSALRVHIWGLNSVQVLEG